MARPQMPAPETDAVDLTTCDREPIHLLGRVQSYGALLAVSWDWIVQHASENLADILGIPFDHAVGTPLKALLPEHVVEQIRSRIRRLDTGQSGVRIFNLAIAERTFDLSLHQSGRHLVLEFEPSTGARDTDALAQIYPLIQRVRDAPDTEASAREAACALQALSGFSTVMVYRFNPDESGEVIAEARLGSAGQSYLGLRFPASDIPKQARALYTRSLLRLISNVDDPGARIAPQSSPEGEALDLSLAVTRAVSPIHIEYLRNMGVAASMSVSILKDGKLWGLFACHHRTPRYVDFETRTAIELFASIFSYELTRMEESARARIETQMRDVQARLMLNASDGEALTKSLMGIRDGLEAIIPHDGLVLVAEDAVSFSGITPTADEFDELRRFFNTAAGTHCFATDDLAQDFPPAAAYAERCAGVLAIPVTRTPRDYLVLCRRSVEQTISWAGAPEKAVTRGPNGARLHPRASFDAYLQTVTSKSLPWHPADLAAAEGLRQVLIEVFLKISDTLSAERKRAQERQEVLIAELNHRVRNILNLMRGLISQSQVVSDGPEIAAFADRLGGRIHALALAHDQLTEAEWAPSSVRALIETEFAAYCEGDARLSLTGSDVLAAPNAFSTLALVFHEMVTNSAKYGALSVPGGRVAVDLARDPGGALTIDWREIGGPEVAPPERRGFGSALIERSIPFELGGEARIEYLETGVTARFLLPAQHLSEARNVVAMKAPATATTSDAARLSGRCLVVEDSMIIAMDAAEILAEFGAEDVQIAASIPEALGMIAANDFSFALLDVNLNGKQSVPIAERLLERGVPFVLATGYGDGAAVKDAYPPCEILQKPFSNQAILAALGKIDKLR